MNGHGSLGVGGQARAWYGMAYQAPPPGAARHSGRRTMPTILIADSE